MTKSSLSVCFAALVLSVSNVNAGVADIMTKDYYTKTFWQAVPVFNYDDLVKISKKYPTFCNTGNVENDKRELAAFLGQTTHETLYFSLPREEVGCGNYCSKEDESWAPCYPDQCYKGRLISML